METKLAFAFRHVDEPDWEWLESRLGNTGEAAFWRSVIREIRRALKQPAPTAVRPLTKPERAWMERANAELHAEFDTLLTERAADAPTAGEEK